MKNWKIQQCSHSQKNGTQSAQELISSFVLFNTIVSIMKLFFKREKLRRDLFHKKKTKSATALASRAPITPHKLLTTEILQKIKVNKRRMFELYIHTWNLQICVTVIMSHEKNILYRNLYNAQKYVILAVHYNVIVLGKKRRSEEKN